MTKWERLRLLIEASLSHDVHYSHDKAYDRYSYRRVLEWMTYLDKEEEKTEKGFLFDDVPEFDKKTWERMLKELRGLA